MNKVNVFGHKSGTLGKVNKVFDIETGLQLVVQNSGYSSGQRAHPQVGHFTQVAFDQSGQRLLAADHLGHFYLFDFGRGRFEHVLHTRHPCTALSFGLRDRRQFLAALADGDVRLLAIGQSGSGPASELASLSGHSAAVTGISPHSGGRYVLTTDPDVTLLWDVDARSRLRRLSVREDVQLLLASFVPTRNLILTAFRDDSLFLWDSETLQCRGQLPTPPPPLQLSGLSTGAEAELGPRYRSLDFTPDGRQLVACGRTRQVHVWDLDSLQMARVLELPASVGMQLCPLRQVAFASSSDAVRSVNLPETEADAGLKSSSSAQHQRRSLALLAVAHSGGVVCVSLGAGGGRSSGATLTNRLQSADSHVTRLAVTKDRLALVSSGQLLIHCLTTALRPESARAAMSARAAANAAAAAAAAADAAAWPAAEPVTDRTDRTAATATDSGGDTGRTYTIVSGRAAVAGGGVSPTKSSKQQSQQQQQQQLPQPQPLNRKRLRAILQEFGQFPGKYRLLIWKTLLQLPENTAAFNALYNKGIHPAFLTLQDRFPLRSNKLGRVLQRSLSCVAFWSPLFGEADYLPLLAFPFVKLFQNSQLHSMEVLMTVLTNWCGHWFEYFPNPPLNILAIIENLIAYHDKELYAHLCARGVTSEILAWPLLQTLLTEVLTREEWLSVWDCLLCHPPGYLLYFVAGFTLLSRGPLLRATEVREFELYYRQPGCLGARDLVKQARQLRTRTPPEICPCRLLPAFAPLGGPQYPLFNRYPVFIVDYQVRERDRLREEERRYLEERRALETAQRRSETQRAEEAAWCRQQELLLAAEERRRAMLAQEETTLREQRRQLAAEQRRARVDELAALTAQRQRLRALQSRHRQVEAQRLGDQLGRRQRQTAAADLEDDIIDDEADGLDDDYDDNGSPGLMPQSGGASAGFGLVSELEGVCQDNGRLEADVGRLLDRLQAARDRLKTSGSAAVRKQKSALNAGTAASLQAAVAAAAANAEGHDDDDATTTTSQSSY
ncbi:hypothetical protein BOX15_Mlig017365g1 [Macrostomum lignano]|uniref:TBC1 domain family member 31 n=1 Tax=Macrostomum lignano TaxID=282301 RepID=A0A267DXX7_9PLAT|nr:hypothetical protein BOX15_Mlig017365g1 [Macrostomum lignano]